MKNITFSLFFFIGFSLLISFGCNGDEEVTPPAPSAENAAFSYSVDPENANRILFSGEPDVETWFTHWDFGDNTASEGLQAEKTFYFKGDYEVRFKIFTESGVAESYKTISIENDIEDPNLLENGSLDNESSWTLLPISNGVEVTFENGTAVWKGGGWGHMGIYQAIEVEADVTYQIQMEVAGSGMSDCWFEVYVGATVPSPGVDYTDGGIRLGLNTWDGCGGEPFNGLLTSLSCSNGGGDGTFQFSSDQTVYFVVRSGGGDLGTEGITVDNLFILPK